MNKNQIPRRRQGHWFLDELVSLVLRGLVEEISPTDLCQINGISTDLYFDLKARFMSGGRDALAGRMPQEVYALREKVKIQQEYINELKKQIHQKEV